MADTSGAKSYVKLALFNGEEEKFQIYWIRMKVYAQVGQIALALSESLNLEIPQG